MTSLLAKVFPTYAPLTAEQVDYAIVRVSYVAKNRNRIADALLAFVVLSFVAPVLILGGQVLYGKVLMFVCSGLFVAPAVILILYLNDAYGKIECVVEWAPSPRANRVFARIMFGSMGAAALMIAMAAQGHPFFDLAYVAVIAPVVLLYTYLAVLVPSVCHTLIVNFGEAPFAFRLSDEQYERLVAAGEILDFKVAKRESAPIGEPTGRLSV